MVIFLAAGHVDNGTIVTHTAPVTQECTTLSEGGTHLLSELADLCKEIPSLNSNPLNLKMMKIITDLLPSSEASGQSSKPSRIRSRSTQIEGWFLQATSFVGSHLDFDPEKGKPHR